MPLLKYFFITLEKLNCLQKNINYMSVAFIVLPIW